MVESRLLACLARVATHDRHGAALHAMIGLNPQALDQARALDDVSIRSGPRGALHGMPLVVKDNIDMAGLPTSSGCLAMACAMPTGDAACVSRVRAAGAVIVGKANLSELCFEIRSRSSVGGDVRNPFCPTVTAGGSSGGTAAAIAAGYAWGGLGTDTGGSIRVPASYNGLVGLRPTHGLVDMQGVAPLAPSADTIGVIACGVADAGLLFEAIGPASKRSGPADPHIALSACRLGVLRQAFGNHPDIEAAMTTALARLAEAGVHVIDPVRLSDEVLPNRPADTGDFVVHEFPSAFDSYLQTNFTSGAPRSLDAIRRSGDHLGEYAALLHRCCRGSVSRARYADIMARRHALAEALQALMHGHDLDALVYPTSATIPVSLDNPAGGWAPELAACSGRPAITLPVGQAANLVPIGLELLGHRHREHELLQVAAMVESLAGRRPVAGLPALPDIAALIVPVQA